MQIAAIITGTIILESLFSVPGMGGLLFWAFMTGEIYVVNSVILIFGLLILLGGFISDLILIALDPRSKIEKQH